MSVYVCVSSRLFFTAKRSHFRGVRELTMCANALAPSTVYFMQYGQTKSSSVSRAFSSSAFSSGYIDAYQASIIWPPSTTQRTMFSSTRGEGGEGGEGGGQGKEEGKGKDLAKIFLETRCGT